MIDLDYNSLPDLVKDELQKLYSETTPSGEKPILSELDCITESFIDKELYAEGGMKRISKVFDQRTSREIVIAELKEDKEIDPENVESFLREARITASLEHPNIVPVYDIGINKLGLPFFTMKHLHGESLKQIIRELLKANPFYLERYPLSILLDIYLKICEAVSFAHSCGVVHLDIKPDNIVLGSYGEVYICDWGIAKLLDAPELEEGEQEQNVFLDKTVYNDITLSGVAKGTPGFMAPEQINRRLAPKSYQTDIYALGALLYTILTFRRPFYEFDAKQTMVKTLKGATPTPKSVLPTVSESLNAVCIKAMNKKPSERYSSVGRLIEDIRSYQSGFATNAEDIHFVKLFGLLLKRNKLLTSMLLIFFITISVIGVVFIQRLEEGELQSEQSISQLEKRKSEELISSQSEFQKKVRQLNREIKERNKKIEVLDSRLEKIRTFDKHAAISLNFVDSSTPYILNYKDVAGVFECGFWENSYIGRPRGDTNIYNLRDNHGIPTGISFTFGSTDRVSSKTDLVKGYNTPTAPANDKMMSNWAAINEFGNISFYNMHKFATKYDVIIYTTRYANSQLSRFWVKDGFSVFSADNSTLNSGPFKQSLYRSAQKSLADKTTNYIRFNDLTMDTLTINSKKLKENWTPICGIQIISKERSLLVEN